MPFTVSCAACDSRFLLGDDLFRRKVSGRVVTVKCRTCNAEISVDATEPKTLPSQELPARRARPAPPRPKHKDGDAATATPMPATATPVVGAATATPVVGAAMATPLPGGALPSIWDAAEKEPTRKAPLPRPHAPSLDRANEVEFIDHIEEGPPSSSDAPSLDTLKHEVHPPRKNHSRKAPDDFLVNLSTGTGGILGAPTIDVMGLGSPPGSDIEELLEVEATELTPRTGTIPLFDMSAVLPLANTAVRSLGSSLSPSQIDLPIDVEMPEIPSESGRPRARKYVVAPKTRQDAPPPKTRRAGAAVWFVLVAAAAGVLLIVGLRARAGSPHPATPEPQPVDHPPSIAENTAASDVAPVAPATIPAAIAPAAAVAADRASATKPSSAATPSRAASPSGAQGAEAIKATTPDKAQATPAIEKPAEVEKPVAPVAARPEPAEPGTDFDRSAAIAALKSAAAEASACRKDGDPSGTASLTITFAPSGRVTSANIQGPPFAGTPTGGCIANAMRHAHVPAFSGDRVTVNKTIVVQ